MSSWITHVIVSQPTHDDRKIALSAIMRIVETCWNIGWETILEYQPTINLGNFNGAVEILMGLKSEKLRPFWLSLRQEEKAHFEQVRSFDNETYPMRELLFRDIYRTCSFLNITDFHRWKTCFIKMCDILLPAHQALPSTEYMNAVGRALRMPQCHLVSSLLVSSHNSHSSVP